MYYIAELTGRKHLFQRPYRIENNRIYITDTKRAKKAFLKKGIENVVFSEEFTRDKIIGEKLKPMKDYDREFVLAYLSRMVVCITDFFKMQLPLGEIAILSDMPWEIVPLCTKYARMVTIAGEAGESFTKDGVNIRQVKKLRTPPDLYISENVEISSVFKIPVIDLSGKGIKTPQRLSYQSLSFVTDVIPFEINADVLMYLIGKEKNLSYQVTSFRKKLPALFTLC